MILYFIFMFGMIIFLLADQAEDLEHALERKEPLELSFDLVLGFSLFVLIVFTIFQLMFAHVVYEISPKLFLEEEHVKDTIASENNSKGSSHSAEH